VAESAHFLGHLGADPLSERLSRHQRGCHGAKR
jgi:hypothetical protein